MHINGTNSYGMLLPDHFSSHCMVALEDGRMVITGGLPSFKTGRKIWILNDTWIPGPDMIHKRYNHACATFRSPLHDNREVVLVAGGTNRDEVELLDFQTNIWEEGT